MESGVGITKSPAPSSRVVGHSERLLIVDGGADANTHEPCWIRTSDPLLKRQMLDALSRWFFVIPVRVKEGFYMVFGKKLDKS